MSTSRRIEERAETSRPRVALVASLLGALLATGCASVQERCAGEDEAKACGALMRTCETGDQDSCALIVRAAADDGRQGVARLEEAEHAAAIGCRKNWAFCDDMKTFIRRAHDAGLDRPVFRQDLESACTTSHYADACWGLGMALRQTDPARAAQFLAIGCDTDVSERSYNVPAIPPGSSRSISSSNLPVPSCGQLIRLYEDKLLTPPSPDYVERLEARKADLKGEQHEQSVNRQAADEAEDAEKALHRNDDANRPSTLEQVAQGMAAMSPPPVTAAPPRSTTSATRTTSGSSASRATDEASATSANAATASQAAAAQKQKNLEACLAEPVTHMRTAQTNPFQAYVTAYQALLGNAVACPSGKGWAACIGMNARIWPDYDAQRDETNYYHRQGALAYVPSGNNTTCLYNQTLGVTRNDCATLGKDTCVQKLQQNVADMQCANEALPRVWEGEIAREDAAAKTRHDDECHRRWR